MPPALVKAVILVEDEARRLVPVRSGALKRSITHTFPRKGKRAHEVEVLMGFKPPISRRAHLTEFGTVHAAARPFMRPALDSKAGEAIRKMGAELHDFFEGHNYSGRGGSK